MINCFSFPSKEYFENVEGGDGGDRFALTYASRKELETLSRSPN
jgi:hypothetical protein